MKTRIEILKARLANLINECYKAAERFERTNDYDNERMCYFKVRQYQETLSILNKF